MMQLALEKMELPASFLASELMRRGGVMAVRGLLGAGHLKELRDDFRAAVPTMRRWVHGGQNQADWRGGEPARALSSGPSGPVEYEIFGSAGMAEALSGLCGLPLEATGAGTYSHYSEPGDFLALHRDIVRCDVAVITCLEEDGGATSRLRAYPADAGRPLSDLYGQGASMGVDVFLQPGDTAILAGGVVPHEVIPLGLGQRRAVAIACFRLKSQIAQ